MQTPLRRLHGRDQGLDGAPGTHRPQGGGGGALDLPDLVPEPHDGEVNHVFRAHLPQALEGRAAHGGLGVARQLGDVGQGLRAPPCNQALNRPSAHIPVFVGQAFHESLAVCAVAATGDGAQNPHLYGIPLVVGEGSKERINRRMSLEAAQHLHGRIDEFGLLLA